MRIDFENIKEYIGKTIDFKYEAKLKVFLRTNEKDVQILSCNVSELVFWKENNTEMYLVEIRGEQFNTVYIINKNTYTLIEESEK